MKKMLSATLMFAAACCFGNAGVFRGNGQTPVLEKSSEIQMVEELVEMRPRRGDYPVDTSCRNLDKMDFRCRFLLRNLTDKRVDLTVGFPVSPEAVFIRKPEELDQTKLVSYFNFVAGTKDRTFPVRFAPWEKKRKFSNIFLWEMTFEPKQEIELFVNYTMEGYAGLATTFRGGAKAFEAAMPYFDRWSENIGMALGQGHSYVTGTGSCWAGRIEKAVFRYYPFAFEEYLGRRGIEEETDERREERFAAMKKEPMYFYRVVGNRRFFRNWEPAPDRWKLVSGRPDRRYERYYELTYAPFTPKVGDAIRIGYVFPFLPENVEGFEALCAEVEKSLTFRMKVKTRILADPKVKKNNPEQYEYWSKAKVEPYSPKTRKVLADIVLEYYGVATGNPDIRDFLTKQIWYPVENPPKMDEAYRKFLLDISRGNTEEGAK